MTEAKKAKLRQFLMHWNEWRKSGAADGHPYSRGVGLCAAAELYEIHGWVSTEKLATTYQLLRIALAKDLGLSSMPFGGERTYLRDNLERKAHLNEARIAWVLKKIEELSDGQS